MNQGGYTKYQRVRCEKLGQWKGERVSIVGKLSKAGNDVKITCDLNDENSCVLLSNFDDENSGYTVDSFIEVRGVMQSGNVMSVEDHNDFGQKSFNLDNYNAMIALMDFNVYG